MCGMAAADSVSTITEGPVPSVAVRWLVYNSTFTNADLAVLSNVSRSWREVVAECVVDAALGNNDGGKPEENCLSRLLVPSWIRELSRSKESLTKDDDDETYCLSWFHPHGLKYMSLIPKSAEEADSRAKALVRWQSYGEATDVFKPFGYSHYLLKRIMDNAQSRFPDDKKPAGFNNNGIQFPKPAKESSTAAVRGALEAIPEGYHEYLDKQKNLDPKKSILSTERPLRKSELHRLVLPRVLRREHPDEDADKLTLKERLEKGFDIPLPFAQFLNMDCSHAVRMQTAPFKKPVLTPITVFCVAIATEDGCFFSGLKEELEMGHMYPTLDNEEINDERSPICINAGYRDHQKRISPRKSKTDLPKQNFLDRIKAACYERPSSGSENDDSESDESEKEAVTYAISGQLGPGAWHCYSTVFDGNQSVIRIDGEEEIMTTASEIPPSFQACLDGITIGSDHSFSMSLCFGQGSDGEGEGAIAELAFFKGHLSTNDMASVESYLMKKHKIPIPSNSRNERIRDDYYSRLAHKLMDQTPAEARRRKDLPTVSIPLRCMTKLRHVAWHQDDIVTGTQRKIQRIGCKVRRGSVSDWTADGV